MKPDCQQCGSCCKGFLIVEAWYLDVLRCDLILTAGHGNSQPTLAEMQAEEDDKCIVLACGLEHPCKFLTLRSICRIYAYRPNTCVYMQAGTIQCTNARKIHGLLPLRHKRTKRKTVPA